MKSLILLFLSLIISCNLSAEPTNKKVRRKIYIRDKIGLITHSLMKGAELKDDYVIFTWSEPHHDFKYYLEISREGVPRPVSTIPVSGGRKRLRFTKKEAKKLFWRVYGKSQYGNVTRNKKKLLVPLKY